MSRVRVAPAALGLGGAMGSTGAWRGRLWGTVRRPAFSEIGLISSLDRGVRQSSVGVSCLRWVKGGHSAARAQNRPVGMHQHRLRESTHRMW